MNGFMDIFGFGRSEEQEIAQMVREFPRVLDQAIVDFAKFKLAVRGGRVTASQFDEISEWFYAFPKLWETVRPSYEPQPPRTDQLAFYEKASAFARKMTTAQNSTSGLGVASIIIAGVAIAAVMGVGGAIWAVGYTQKQRNISEMIDLVADKQLPVSVLQEAIKQEEMSLIGGFGDTAKWVVIAIGAVLGFPLIRRIIK